MRGKRYFSDVSPASCKFYSYDIYSRVLVEVAEGVNEAAISSCSHGPTTTNSFIVSAHV